METREENSSFWYKLGRAWGRLRRADRVEAARPHWMETLSAEQRLELMKLEQNPLRRSVMALAFLAVIALFFLPLEIEGDFGGEFKVDTDGSNYEYSIPGGELTDKAANFFYTGEFYGRETGLFIYPGNVSIEINGAEGKLTGKYYIKGPWISVFYAAYYLGGK